MRSLLAAASLLLLFAGAPGLARQAEPVGAAPIDAPALTSFIKRSIEPATGLDSGALGALRQLRDPRLRPLFAHLAMNGPEPIRAGAALGLADLDEPPRLDPLIVLGLPPTAMEEALRRGEREGRLVPELVASLSAKADLPERIAGLLALSAARTGATPDTDLAARLTESSDLRAVATGCVLFSIRASPGADSALDRLLSDTSPVASEARAGLLADLRLAARIETVPLLASLSTNPALAPQLRAEALEMLLQQDPNGAIPLWTVAFEEDTALASRLRLALVALHAIPRTPPRVFETLMESHDSLLRAIGAAGRAASQGELRADLCAPLIASSHPATIAWVLDAAAGMPNQDASAVRRAVIALLRGGSRVEWAVMEQAVRAASSLAEESAADFAQAYTDACWAGDEGLAQALLLGVLRARSPRALGAIAAQEPPGPEAKALAAIVIARGEATLTQPQLEALDRAAGGSGGISDARRLQASWLLLRHTGADRAALARMLATDGE